MKEVTYEDWQKNPVPRNMLAGSVPIVDIRSELCF